MGVYLEKNTGFVKVRNLMFEYPTFDKQIQMIRDDIFAPFNENCDENVGGGKSSFSKMFEQDWYILRTEYHKATLDNLYKRKSVIQSCLAEEDEYFKKYIESYYFKREKKENAVALSCYSWSTIKRKRAILFRKIAFKLGIFWAD